jgi:hypothetical protein
MAMFAEFDNISRASSAQISPVLNALQYFFPRPLNIRMLEEITGTDFGKVPSMYPNLYAMRLDDALITKKASLLMMPSTPRRNAYTLGYLAIKSLWRTLSRADHRLLNEPDLFLIYIKSFIFDDWGMAATALAPGMDDIRAAERMANYVNARLAAIDEVEARDISEFEEFALANPADRPRIVPGIRVPREVAEAGVELADGLAEALVEVAKAGSVEARLVSRAVRVLRRRAYMHVCSTSVEILESDNTELAVSWQGNRLLTCSAQDAFDRFRPKTGPAVLDVVFSVGEGAALQSAAILSRNGAALACIPLRGRLANETRKTVLEAFIQREALIEEEHAIKGRADIAVEQSWINVSVKHVRKQLDPIVAEMYRDVSLKFAASYEAIDFAYAHMQVDGLMYFFPTVRELRSAALLGLASSISPSKAVLRKIFAANRLDLDETLAAFKRLYIDHGYPPELLEAANDVFTTV